MTDKPITRLEHARILKQLNIPLNTPAEDRTFSQKYTEHWVALMNAHTEFMLAMCECFDGAQAQSPGKWRVVRRRLVALGRAAGRCVDFVAVLGGNVPVGVEPVFASEQDEQEYLLLAWFIAERAIPFIRFWEDAIDEVAAGGSLTIAPGDVPRWTDETLGDPPARP
jgi:hypothetical protein